jgi:FKBP-type peptidyl-prolyl cis-trans isomerase
MKIITDSLPKRVVVMLGVAFAARLTVGAQQPSTNSTAAPTFASEKDKLSYAVGVALGNTVKHSRMDPADLNFEIFTSAFRDTLGGAEPTMAPKDVSQTIADFQRQKVKQLAAANLKIANDFFATNKLADGIKTLPVALSGGQTQEIQYRVLKEGTGPIPATNDIVSVNYRGTFLDGKEFDNSTKHEAGGPAHMKVNAVIPGWTAALEHMAVGSKWQIFLPPNAAYGESGYPRAGIDPNTALVFDMELVGIGAPPPPAPPQPPPTPKELTSDIVRVPSTEEQAKGAKPEIIKAEDLKNYTNGAAGTNKP